MSLFAQAKAAAANVKVEEKDVLGGGFTIPSGIYKGGIKIAYIDKWKSGALFVGLELAVLVDGKERVHKELITISNKEGSFTYTDKKTGDAIAMPGYVAIDTLFKTACGKGFMEQEPVVKAVKLYNSEKKAEVEENREVFMDVLNKVIHIGMIEQEVDKTAKDPMSGDYVPTGETRKENVLSKVFDGETLQTSTEKAANKPAEFHKGWSERFAGKCIKKSKGAAAGANAPQAGAPVAGTAPAVGSLFGA